MNRFNAISFSGAGWRLSFHFGVIHYLQKNDLVDYRNLKVGGSSAGGIGALSLLLQKDMVRLQQRLLEAAVKIHYKYKLVGGNWTQVIEKTFTEVYETDKNPRLYQKANRRLFINVSRPPWRKELISEFHSNRHLLDVLLATQFIPTVCQKMTRPNNGLIYFDGSLTDNFPHLGPKTLRIGFNVPLNKKKAHIGPSIQSGLRHTLRPDTKVMENLFSDGYAQAKIMAASILP